MSTTFAHLWEGTKEQDQNFSKISRPERTENYHEKKRAIVFTVAAAKLLCGIGWSYSEEVCRKTQLSVNCIKN